MKLLTLLAIGLLGVCVTACGSSSQPTAPAPKNSPTNTTALTTPTDAPPAPVKTRSDSDRDNDIGAPGDDTNNSVLHFGHAANATDTQAITTLIKRYYTAALAENGAKACSMMYSTLAESVPEDYGQSPPGEPYMRGTTCPAVLKLLFKHEHLQLKA